jgi:small-conductance mechanosensitive channel
MATLILLAFTALVWLAKLTGVAENSAVEESLMAGATALTVLVVARLVELLAIAFGPRSSGSGHTDRVRTMIRVAIYSTAALVWSRFYLGFDVTGLLATSAAATLVLGLAAQTTLGNLFAGLALEMERPAGVGDMIVKGGLEGEVVALKWRSIFLKTLNNTIVVIPNSKFGEDTVEIFRLGEPFRLQAYFTTPSGAPPAETIGAAEAVLRSGIEKVCPDPAPSVVLVGMDATTGHLRYCARFFTVDLPARQQTLSEVQVRLWYGLSRVGVRISPALEVEEQPNAATPKALTEPEIVDVVAASRPAQDLAKGGLDAAPRDLIGLVRRHGETLAFGPGETIDLAGGAALLAAGSASVCWPKSEEAIAREIESMRAGKGLAGADRITAKEAERAGRAAAVHLGPLAFTLAERYAACADDPFFLWRALASHISGDDERLSFLRGAPSQPSRRLEPGALFGWTRAMRANRASCALPRAESWATVIRVAPERLRPILAEATDAASLLANAEPGLEDMSENSLQDWLRGASAAR